MKILITCQYYWPDNFLITDIAEELVKRGNEVVILTGLPDYTTTKVPNEYKYFKKRHEFHNGVEIIRVPIIARHHGFIFRILNYLSYFISSSFYALTHKIESDVIFSYQLAPILMVNPGIILKKKMKKSMFIYVLDIWPDQMKIWNVKENNLLFKIVHKYSKYAYQSGDLIGITSKPFKKYLVDVNKVDPSKIIYLPQYSEKMKICLNKKSTKEEIDLIFAGNIGDQQNIECLLNAISLVKTKNKFHVHFYGNGTNFENCKVLSKKLKLENKVTFYGRISKNDLDNIYPNMDALLLTLCSEEKIGFAANTVPAKLQKYMSIGKPIIASIDGGAYEILKESNSGIVVHANETDNLAMAIKDFVENPTKYQKCGVNAINYFNKYFEKNIVMDKLENILKDLSKKEEANND